MGVNESSQKIIEKLQVKDPLGHQFVTEYKMRDWLVSRQRYWGAPIPAIECSSCGWVAATDLPILLPEIEGNTALLN